MPITDVDLDSLHDKGEAAAKLHVSTRTVDRMVRDREIEYIKIRGRIYFTKRAIVDVMDRFKVKAEVPRRGGKPSAKAASAVAARVDAEQMSA